MSVEVAANCTMRENEIGREECERDRESERLARSSWCTAKSVNKNKKNT